MRTWNVLLVGGATVAMAVTAYGQAPKTPASIHQQTHMSAAQQGALVDRYCSDCHNPDTKSGGMTLTDLNFQHPEKNIDLAEDVIRKVTVGMMPPPGRQRPDAATMKLFAASLAGSIDTYAMAHPDPGDPALHRLNRAEYQNSVHELLGVDANADQLLPPDDMSHSFDNMADALTLSPTLMQAYIRSAGEISREALGDRNAVAQASTYVVPLVVSQVQHVDGAPLGTRGGISVVHDFPADGLYSFKVSFYFSNVGFLFGTTQGKTQYIEISVNGARVAVLPIDPSSTEDDVFRTPPIAVNAGPQRVSAAFLKAADGPVQDSVEPTGFALLNLMQAGVAGLTTLPHVEFFTIAGPTQMTGVSETPSRKLIFSCYPKDAAEETPCATKIVAHLASQAYRRPVTPEEMAALMKLYALGHSSNNGGFEGGVGVAIQAILADPSFIYRFEHNRPLVKQNASAAVSSLYPISDVELASRLSYFLWSAAPDATLLDLAEHNQLHQSQVLTAQVHRMLLDPRSFALSANFAREWLHLQNLQSVQPDAYMFHDYDKNLGNSMLMETELFFNSVVHDDANVLTLLDGHYTFVNQQLAQLYDIPDVLGTRFRRVELTDPNRFGLLGQAGILTLTSASNRTSPTIRGKYVMEVLLGSPPPPPPPIVPALEEATAGVGAHVPTVRERLEEHRKNPTCAACHSFMDPIGFALENYDPIGGWRGFDSGAPIDAAGKLFDGTPVSSPADLRGALVAHSDSFIGTFTENLFAYGMGRVLRPVDMPVVRSIEREAAAHNDAFSAFVLGIVNSEPFRMRSAEPLPKHLLATIDTKNSTPSKAGAQQHQH
jgi:mono/diheme cytochrome c family protein